MRTLAQPLAFDHVEHRQPDLRRNRVATEGVEVLHSALKGLSDGTRRQHGSERMAVTDWLAEGQDVGPRTLCIERPHRAADATEADLHFVGDADATSRADRIECARQVSRRWHDLATAPHQRLGQEGGQPMPTLAQRDRRRSDAIHVVRGSSPIVNPGRPVSATVRIRHRSDLDPISSVEAPLALELVRAQFDQPLRVAVVPPIQNHHAIATGVRARKPKRQFIGFATATDKEAHVKQPRSCRQ